MAIGDLYDADNVIVGQAAVFFGAQNTALPDLGALVTSDPFAPTPWVSQTLTMVTGATGVTLTDPLGNVTSALAFASTLSEVQAALDGLNNGITYVVTGSSGAFVITPTGDYIGNLVLTGTDTDTTLSGGLWVPTGATDQGWKYGTDKSVTTINIEEQSTAVGQTIATQSVTLDASLSEDVSRTLKLAYNATVATVAPSADEPGYDLIELSDDVQYYAVAMVTSTPQGFPRVIYAPKWAQLANTSTDFRRASAKRMYPVTFTTLCKPAQVQIFNLTSAKTS